MIRPGTGAGGGAPTGRPTPAGPAVRNRAPDTGGDAGGDGGQSPALREQSRTLFSLVEPLFDLVTVF